MQLKSTKEFYSEAEAAKELGISLARLHIILDAHLFADGSPRPEELTFRQSDLVLLAFWDKCTPYPKIVRMPRRV